MPIVSEQYPTVVGVDCHAATNTLAVIDAATGAELDSATFPTTTAGLARATTWVQVRVEAGSVLCVVEGIGSYGAGIARALTAAQLPVVEPSVIAKAEHRGRGKSDQLDAVRIAKSVLGVQVSRLRQPRQDGGHRTALQVLTGAGADEHRAHQADQHAYRAAADDRSGNRCAATVDRPADRVDRPLAVATSRVDRRIDFAS